jgi:hypothetical protein
MQSRAPFQILQISKQPILSGDELYYPGHKFWKPKVRIVYGAVEEGDGWLLSLGANDSACEMAGVKKEDLFL